MRKVTILDFDENTKHRSLNDVIDFALELDFSFKEMMECKTIIECEDFIDVDAIYCDTCNTFLTIYQLKNEEKPFVLGLRY